MLHCVGEFGEVYKAHLIKWHGEGMPKTVAVKTLRGICYHVYMAILTGHNYIKVPCDCP